MINCYEKKLVIIICLELGIDKEQPRRERYGSCFDSHGCNTYLFSVCNKLNQLINMDPVQKAANDERIVENV